MNLTIYTDGASRGNPGRASYGFVIFDENKNKIHEAGGYIGVNTNNFAEYTAVIKSLEYASKRFSGKISVQFFMDSKLVVEQLSGRFKVKSENLRPLIAQIRELESKYKQISYQTIIPIAVRFGHMKYLEFLKNNIKFNKIVSLFSFGNSCDDLDDSEEFIKEFLGFYPGIHIDNIISLFYA